VFRLLRNIFKIKDIRNKVLFTLFILLVYRLGASIPVPGIDLKQIQHFFEEGIFGFLDLFSGGAMSNFAVFSLGIMPYITSSIIMQLLQMVIPKIEQWAKGGESGRKRIQQISRYMTVGLALFQSTAMVFFFRGAIKNFTPTNVILMIATLTAGTALIMWLGELITQKGIGNGISLIIFTSIISRFLPAVVQMFRVWETNIVRIIVMGIIAVVVIAGIVIMTQGERKISVQYAKQVRGRRIYGGRGTYIPMKVNTAGVIPVIFASSFLLFPAMIARFLPYPWLQTLANILSPGARNEINWIYIVLYAIFIVAFTYFYSAVVFNPLDIADNFRKYGGFVPGIRPGKPTASHLSRILNRITLPGSIFLAAVAVLPEILYATLGIPFRFGGTSLIIVVGVALETMKALESQLIMRDYEGFLK
jgi:preprotein translocase subunit SecY